MTARSGLALLLIPLLWELSVRSGSLDARFLPPLSEVLPVLFGLLRSPEFLGHVGASLALLATGLAASAFAGCAGAILVAHSRWAESLLVPNIELVRSIAPLALWPAFMLVFGIGTVSKGVMIFWVAWIPIFLNLLQGIRKVDPDHLKISRLYGASRWQTALTIQLPSALPYLMIGLRLAAGNAFLAIVAAEMIGSSSGLGFYILETSQTFRIREMYSAILVIGALGFLLNAAFVQAESRLFERWRG